MRGVAKREQIEAALDVLPDSELDPVLEFIVSRGENGTSDESGEDEPVVVGLPESWKTFEDGTPQPNWTALIRADRDSGH
jgi:hypothetical protein